jgi:predicted Fe-Mo cluster-binding NifX family protein
MILCAPITAEGSIDHGWGRVDRVAVADVVDDKIVSWHEIQVSWSQLHDEGTPGSHHARVVTFLRDHHVKAVVVEHMGDGMARSLATMNLPVHMGAAGDAREAVLAAAREL